MCHFSIKRTTILTFNFLNANFQQEMSVTFVNQIFISEKKKKINLNLMWETKFCLKGKNIPPPLKFKWLASQLCTSHYSIHNE